MKNADICVLIPAYNEESSIGVIIKEVSQHFSNIICIDDGSRDDTISVIKKSKKSILMSHPFNMGQGAAIQTGLELALKNKNYKYFITIDSDGQHQTNDMLPLVDYIKKNKLDIVLGSRFMGEAKNIGKFKAVFVRCVGLYNKYTTKINVSDPHIGLRIFNRKFAESLNITLPGYAHASEIIEAIRIGGYKYGEVPVTVLYTDYSKNKGQPMINAVNVVFDHLYYKATKK